MYCSGGTSITVQPQKDINETGVAAFSAHNLKVAIRNNKVTRARSEGISLLNMALTSLELTGNDLNQNALHNLYIK
jgi:hypothetical protein